jgi:hypothetical protein
MATDNKMGEYEAAFGEDNQAAAPQSDDEAFGLTMPANAAPAGAEAVAPVAVVAEEKEKAGYTAAEAEECAANEAAAATAKAATDENNAKASTAAKGETTGTQEASEASGEGGPKEATIADVAIIEAPEAGASSTPAATEVVADSGAEGGPGKAPMSEQQLRSWEGRLRKAEQELKAKAPEAGDGMGGDAPVTAAADAIEKVSDQAGGNGDNAMAEAASEVADQVASGEITPEEAMKALAEDFGEPFVKMIEAIARSSASKAADEKIGKVGQDVEAVISHITNNAERAHFEAIYQAHPDFIEVSKSPEFQAFVESQGPTAESTIESGSASAINAIIDAFKAATEGDKSAGQPGEMVASADGSGNPQPDEGFAPEVTVTAKREDQVDPEAVEAAEGVRSKSSSGLRLPEAPSRAEDDYEGAWNDF